MLELILKSLYFFLPAFVANSVPVYAKRFNWFLRLDRPIDGGATFNGKRVFGDHKTTRGFVVGIIFSVAVGVLQFVLYRYSDFFKEISLIDYGNLIISITFAVFQGFGALFGDAAKSFLKRRAGIAPGKAWVGPDQIDYVLGGLLFSLPFLKLDYRVVITLLLLGPVLHIISNILMKLLGIRKEWM